MCIIKQTNLKLCEGVLWYLAARCQQEILQILQLTRWGLFAGSDFLVPTTAKEVLSMEAHICLIGLRLDHLEAKSTPKTHFCARQTTGEPFFSLRHIIQLKERPQYPGNTVSIAHVMRLGSIVGRKPSLVTSLTRA